MAELNLLTLRSSIVNLLHKNNVTSSSYFISKNLYKKVTEVVGGYHVSKAIPSILYPRVWVELKTKKEEWANVGRQNLRNSEIDFDIVGVVDQGLGQYDGREVSDNEMITLGTNIEKLFRNFTDLSLPSYVMQSLLTGSEYDVVESNDTYNSIVRIGLQVTTFST